MLGGIVRGNIEPSGSPRTLYGQSFVFVAYKDTDICGLYYIYKTGIKAIIELSQRLVTIEKGESDYSMTITVTGNNVRFYQIKFV